MTRRGTARAVAPRVNAYGYIGGRFAVGMVLFPLAVALDVVMGVVLGAWALLAGAALATAAWVWAWSLIRRHLRDVRTGDRMDPALPKALAVPVLLMLAGVLLPWQLT